MERVSRWAPLALGVLRIVAALLFIEHGTQKLFGFPAGENPPVGFQMTLIGLAGILEAFGGLLLLLGLFTRPTAFILAGEMAVAYFMAHAPNGAIPMQNGGELAALYAFVFLFFSANGPGPLSIDRNLLGRTTDRHDERVHTHA